jgi:hypothetical protein
MLASYIFNTNDTNHNNNNFCLKHGTCLKGLLEEGIISNTEASVDAYLEAIHDVPLDDIQVIFCWFFFLRVGAFFTHSPTKRPPLSLIQHFAACWRPSSFPGGCSLLRSPPMLSGVSAASALKTSSLASSTARCVRLVVGPKTPQRRHLPWLGCFVCFPRGVNHMHCWLLFENVCIAHFFKNAFDPPPPPPPCARPGVQLGHKALPFLVRSSDEK